MLNKTGRTKAPWWRRAAPDAGSLDDVVDPEIDGTPPEQRARLAAIWQKRGGLELRVAASFSTLSVELLEHGAEQVVYEGVAQAIRDEVHHAQISIELAAKYRGGGPQWPAPEPTHVPPFAPTKGALHATLYIIAMCCINETMACAVLETAAAQAKSPLARAAFMTILSDEIEHARVGWAHLASSYVTPEMKRVLPAWLRRLHGAKLTELLDGEGPLLPGEDFDSHGILKRARLHEVVYATLVDVMFPGFRQADIDTGPTEEWVREAFAAVTAA